MAEPMNVVKRFFCLSQSISIDLLRPAIVCVLVMLSCSSFGTEAGSDRAATQTFVKTLHLTPPKPGESRYLYVPFQVPPNTSRISFSYEYEKTNGSNALDIGVFDSRATANAGDVSGFRGWSGGRRSEVFISRDDATPGYIPGELPAGTWRIILGLYRIVPEGVDVTCKIDFEIHENNETNLAPAASPTQRFAVPSLSSVVMTSQRQAIVARKAPFWVSGDLHLHTINSDGDWTVPQLMIAAKNASLDFIAITDHNTYSHHAEIDRLSNSEKDLLVIRGEEITTYGGHVNAWGLASNALIDFRVQPGDREAMSRIASEARRRGCVVSINHPFAACVGCNWSYDAEANGFDAIEVWNGSWDNLDEQALALWDSLLQKGRRITAIAASDSHRPTSPVGQPTTHVAIDSGLSVAAVLNSIRAGRAYLTSSVSAPVVRFEAEALANHTMHSIGDVIRPGNSRRLRFKFEAHDIPASAAIFLISHGRVIRTLPVSADGQPQFVEVDSDSHTYFRVEVRDQNGMMLALTNPIYVEGKR